MNPGYFTDADTGVGMLNAWAMPSTGFEENFGARWDEMRTPDHGSIYDQRARDFYDEATAKLREHGVGDYPNPYLLVAPEYEQAFSGQGNPALVDAVRRALPKDYYPGSSFNPFAVQAEWRKSLDQIIVDARKTYPDLPDPTTFDQGIAKESGETRARAADIGSRATFMGGVGGFVGATAGNQSRDEEITMTLLTLPFGGVAGSMGRILLTRVLLTAATDGFLAAAQTGVSERNESKFQEEHFGYSKSGDEILSDMAYAAVSGALIGVAGHGLSEGAGYLLSRWRSGRPRFGSSAAEEDVAPSSFPSPEPTTEFMGDAPVAVGLGETAEIAQEIYPLLPRAGRDAADIVDNEVQIATTGPADDLTTHALNVELASGTVAADDPEISVAIWGRNYFESEATPSDQPVSTNLGIVEFDELNPGSRLRRQMHSDIDAKIEELKAMSDDEIIKFRIKGTLTPDGKPKRGGKTVESYIGFGVHTGFTQYQARKPPRYVKSQEMKWAAPPPRRGKSGAFQIPDARHSIYKVVAELKPDSRSGRYRGKIQRQRYENELGVSAVAFKWSVTRRQAAEIEKIKKRIGDLQISKGLLRSDKRTE